jgi:hypothetical protein
MRINPLLPKKAKAAKAARSRLPGERAPFKERTRDSVHNAVPPQHLGPDGNVASSREREVTRTDPLLARIRELEEENKQLRAALNHKQESR